MTIRLRDTKRKELRDPRMAEHGAPKFLLMRCGALLRLDGRDAHPYTSNGWAGVTPVPTRAKATAGPGHEKCQKRAFAEILSSPLEPRFPAKLLIRMEI